jgi:hypothetical protein
VLAARAMAKAYKHLKRFDESQATPRTNVHSTATFDFIDSFIGMRRIAIAGISGLLLLLTAGASGARARRQAPAKCTQVHARPITANAQAQVYEATEPGALSEYLGAWGCAYGHNRPYFLGSLPYGSSSGGSAGGVEHETLAGPIVAYEESSASGELGDEPTSRNVVIVRDLRTGRVLHRVPTGVPLKPEQRYVGVGNVVSMVVKSDGAVGWIADDYERSHPSGSPEVSYFDVYAVDKSGARLLAAGTDVDPSSLALSVTGTNIGQGSRTALGSTLYWTQGGKSFSTTLN